MEIEAKIIADSVDQNDCRITTMELKYHRYILPEVNTHRVLSKNGASSRAIPTKTLIQRALEDQVEPVEWGLHQSGMQAFNTADEILEKKARKRWNKARKDALKHASKLNELGLAKQIVNRVMEPFSATRTVITGTDWANWYGLRDHEDAQPEIQVLARKMAEARDNSTPSLLTVGQWHLPYILPEDREKAEEYFIGTQYYEALEKYMKDDTFAIGPKTLALCMVSAARCARVSYRTSDGNPTKFEDDLILFERLVGAQPVHASPTEHQARPFIIGRCHETANYRNFLQFRRMLKGETILDEVPS